MGYLLTFLEGIITFISPCMLPMLPLYLSYFSGGETGKARTLRNTSGFILGFTIVFLTLGYFAGQLGGFLVRNRRVMELVGGGIVVLFGLFYMGILQPAFLLRTRRMQMGDTALRSLGFGSSVLFGIVFSIGWSPCVGPMLSAALITAAGTGHKFSGMLMLLCYAAGLGIPFLLSALLLDYLKSAIATIKRHYRAINLASGALLVVVGITMMTGWLGQLAAELV